MDVAKKLINALDPKYILKQENPTDSFGKRLTKMFHKSEDRIKSGLARARQSTRKHLSRKEGSKQNTANTSESTPKKSMWDRFTRKKKNENPSRSFTNTPISLGSNTRNKSETVFENPMRKP